MITAHERSDLIHIMKMNRLNLADSDSAQLEFTGHVNGKHWRIKILEVDSAPQLIIQSNGEAICNESMRSVDDLKIFLEERLYRYLAA
jgi:hypothetical protein